MSRRTVSRREKTSFNNSATSSQSPTWHAWGIPLAVGILTLLVFLPTLRNDFVAWDDQTNFLENPYYRGLGLANLKWMWSTFLLGHYVPLSWMSLGLDYTLWGMNPTGYHLTSILLHAANAVLLYVLACQLLGWSKTEADPGTAGVIRLGAALAALLFAIHPLRVESVAWVTERRDVLSGFFYLATLISYLQFAKTGARRWYWMSLGLYLAALLSKGTSVTLPAVLLVLNVYPLRRITSEWFSPRARAMYLELVPFVALAAGFVIMTFVALQSMPQLPVGQKIAVSAFSLVFYLRKTIIPTGLVPLYDMPPDIDPLGLPFVGCYALVIAISAGAFLFRKRRPGVFVAWILFVGILFPLLGVHQNGPQIAADRYTYNAAPVLAILAAAGWISLRRPASALMLIVPAIVLSIFGVATWRQTEIWKDSRMMWSAVLNQNPRSSIALTAMGNVETKDGHPDSAAVLFFRSLDVDPKSPEAENNLGIALSRLGKLQEALAHFQRASSLKADYYEAENNIGLTIASLGGNAGDAIAHYRAALRMKPDYPDAHVNWGNALVQQGIFDEAISHYQQALAMRPDDADAHLNWGVALARQNRFGEAAAHFTRTLELRPGFASAQRMLDQALALEAAAQKHPPR